MKLLNAKTLAALALTGAMSIGTASAMGLDSGIKPLTSVAGISSTNISVKVDDGVATLFGFVDSNHEHALAEAHVADMEGVDRVINRLIRN
jgi:hypothetical protein